MGDETAVRFAVENMYPWRARSRELAAYAPGWDNRDEDYPHTTIDLSHTAVSGTDAVAMAEDLGDSPEPHPPCRRHGRLTRRAPDPRPRQPALR